MAWIESCHDLYKEGRSIPITAFRTEQKNSGAISLRLVPEISFTRGKSSNKYEIHYYGILKHGLSYGEIEIARSMGLITYGSCILCIPDGIKSIRTVKKITPNKRIEFDPFDILTLPIPE